MTHEFFYLSNHEVRRWLLYNYSKRLLDEGHLEPAIAAMYSLAASKEDGDRFMNGLMHKYRAVVRDDWGDSG